MACKKTVNIGVLLEDSKDRVWMQRILAHDASLDYVIVPDSLEKMWRYFGHLAQRDICIKKLVLMGHGAQVYPHIGRLQPRDVDIDTLRKQGEKLRKGCNNAEKEVERLTAQLGEAEDAGMKRNLKTARDDLDSYRFDYDQNQKKLQMLDLVAEAFAKDALIGLFSCYAAYDKKAKAVMRNLGKILLEKRGGRVVGFTGMIWTPRKIHSIIAWLAGSEDVVAYPFGEMKVLTVRPGRCGKPCRDFKRYGYCDNARAKDGGPCWTHC